MPPIQWAWTRLGNPFGQTCWPSSLDLDVSEQPVVAMTSGDLLSGTGFVRQWTGTTWQALGSLVPPQAPGLFRPNFEHALGAGQSPPTVAYSIYGAVGLQRSVEVSQWNGVAWQALGGPPNVQRPFRPALLTTPNGPVVAFEHYGPGATARPAVQVHQWAGGGWIDLTPSRSAGMMSPDLALDANGDILLAVEAQTGTPRSGIRVLRWDGATWRAIGRRPIPGRRPSLAVGSGGQVCVASVVPHSAAASTLEVRSWTGSAWQATSPAISWPSSDYGFSLAVEAGGAPVLAYENPNAPGRRRIEVSWWTGAGWLTFSPPLGPLDSSSPRIAIDSQDRPVVVWGEGDLSVFEGPDATRRIIAARLVLT